jgi:glycosyltransferase involved in cell wall biosynthesis
MPNDEGGATGAGCQFLLELSRQGVEIDCYFPLGEAPLPKVLEEQANLRFYLQPNNWRWNRWYSRNQLMAFVTGQLSNLYCEMKLAKKLAENHQRKPYDFVYQFSHIEMHALKRHKDKLPPILLHPSVHAAGELQWHRREAHLSRESEPWLKRMLVRLLLLVRAKVQQRHIQLADHVLSLSKTFADEMIRDYRIHPAKVAGIVPNPIDLEKYSPGRIRKPEQSRGGPITFLFVSRISVRKGTEMIVELSHRLQDLAGQVRIVVVGNHSLWSDYRRLLSRLNPQVAEYRGAMSSKELVRLYHSVDALIQPSHYEPFGLTVGEALACGLPVVASDKVGAAENVDALCCRVFPAGDMDALEKQVRRLFEELRTPRRVEISAKARSEAVRLFADKVIVSDLIFRLESLAQAK